MVGFFSKHKKVQVIGSRIFLFLFILGGGVREAA